MAIAWKDVIAKPDYQALSPEQKAQAQEQYFNEVVAPQAGSNANAAKQQFYAAYPVATPQQAAQQQRATTQPQQQEKEEPGFLRSAYDSVKEAITGAERMTPEMEQLEPVGNAPELNALTTDSFKAGLAQLFGSDASQEQVLQSMGGKIRYDAKGNTIVDLPSGSYAVNKPGLSPQDVTSGISNILAFTPAAKAGSILKAGIGSAATEATTKGLVQAAGGEDVSPIDVGLAGGLGAFGKGLEQAGGALYRGLKGVPSGDAAAAREFAESAGTPLMTSDIAPPGTFIGRSAQAAAEKVPLTGTGGLRRDQQAAREKIVQDFANKFGDYDPQEVVQSLQRQTSKVKQAAGNRLSETSQQMQGVNISPSGAIGQIDQEIARLKDLGKVADSQTIAKLQNYRDELAKGADFSKLQNLRTQFRQDVKGERPVMPNQSDAAVQRIYSAMSKDMQDAISSNLGPESLAKWQKANSVYANEAQKIKNTRLKSVLQKGDLTPEVVNNMLYSNKPSEVRALYTSLDSKGKDAMRAGIIGKAWEKSGGSPDRFLNQIDKLQGQIGVTFGSADKQYLNGLKNYLEHTRRAGTAGVLTPTGQELFQIGAPAAVASDVLGTGGMGTLGAAAYGGIARIYESKPVRNALLRLNSIKKGTTAFERQAQKVQALMTGALQSSRD